MPTPWADIPTVSIQPTSGVLLSFLALKIELWFPSSQSLAVKVVHVRRFLYASPTITICFLHGKFVLWIKEPSFRLQGQYFLDSITLRNVSDQFIQPVVESAVTRLLVAIKQLLESLTLWSTLNMTEEQVSDVYVKLGNEFNAAVSAFTAFDIDMSCVLYIYYNLTCI